MARRGEGQPKFPCELSAEPAGSQKPDRNLKPCSWHSANPLSRRGCLEKASQFRELLRKFLACVVGVTAQYTHCHLISARRAAEPKINPPRIQALQGPKLLRNDERRRD